MGNLNTLNDRPETDAAGYLEMLKQLKEAMPDAELTAAVSDNLFREEGDDGELHPVDMEPYIPYFTRLYLMNYDFWGVEQEEVANSGSNGALYPNPEEGQRNGKATTMLWHNNGKFPMDKLSYGTLAIG